jgi:hypothetical protein
VKSNKDYVCREFMQPARNARVRCCLLRDVLLYDIFSTLSHKGTIYEKKLLNLKYVFVFSLRLFLNISHFVKNVASSD